MTYWDTQRDRAAETQARRYRIFVNQLPAEAFENERYTVVNEWRFAESDYRRRYPDLTREDLLSILCVDDVAAKREP